MLEHVYDFRWLKLVELSMEDVYIYLNWLIILTVSIHYLEMFINVYENIYPTNILKHKKRDKSQINFKNDRPIKVVLFTLGPSLIFP